MPLTAIEGAVCRIVCLMPAAVSSEVVWGGVIAEGDMFAVLQHNSR